MPGQARNACHHKASGKFTHMSDQTIHLTREKARTVAGNHKKGGRQSEDADEQRKTLLVDALRSDYPLKSCFTVWEYAAGVIFQRASSWKTSTGHQREDRSLFEENGGRYGYIKHPCLAPPRRRTSSEKIAAEVRGMRPRGLRRKRGRVCTREKAPGAESLIWAQLSRGCATTNGSPT